MDFVVVVNKEKTKMLVGHQKLVEKLRKKYKI